MCFFIINIYYSPSKKMLGWCQLLDLPVIPPVSQAPFVHAKGIFTYVSHDQKTLHKTIIFHHFPMVFHHFPSFSHGFPSFSHGFPSFSIIFPWFSLIFHHFPTVFHHFPMVFPHFPSFSHGFPSFSIIFPWFLVIFLPMSPQMSRSFLVAHLS